MPNDPIQSITVKGFKSIASIEDLELRQINVIIGANGSGKSNFLGIFKALRAVQDGRLGQYVRTSGGAERILHFGSKFTSEVSVRLDFASDAEDFPPSRQIFVELVLEKAAGDQLVLNASQGMDLSIGGQPYEASNSYHFYHIDDTSTASGIRNTARVNDNRYLHDNGNNLGPFLYLLQRRYSRQYDEVCRAVKRVAPYFDDFQLSPENLKPDTILIKWRHANSDHYFDAYDLSDGTLRFIALATAFLQPDEFLPSLMLIDEPELGLHPAAIAILAALIKQASLRTQLIISTQSPLLIDYFEPEDILVADLVENATQLTRQSRADLAAWLDEYSLGQLWEKNRLGGRPSHV